MPDSKIKYLANCFLLLVPVFIWNLVFANRLPAGYVEPEIWDEIPLWVHVMENLLRAAVFLLPLTMKFALDSPRQKIGMGVYVLGILVYFAAWAPQLFFPDGAWSLSVMGFMAPAYTPVLWLLGIALVGRRTFPPLPRIDILYMVLSILFAGIHTYHSYLAFQNPGN